MVTYVCILLLATLAGRRTIGQAVMGGIILTLALGIDEIFDAWKYGNGFDYGDMYWGTGAIAGQAIVARAGERK